MNNRKNIKYNIKDETNIKEMDVEKEPNIVEMDIEENAIEMDEEENVEEKYKLIPYYILIKLTLMCNALIFFYRMMLSIYYLTWKICQLLKFLTLQIIPLAMKRPFHPMSMESL